MSAEINGVTTVASRKDSFLSGRRFVDEWILPGSNEIAIRVQASSSKEGPALCSLALYAVKSRQLRFEDDSSENARKVYSFTWQESPTNAGPLRTNESFWIDEAPPSLLATKGEVLKFTETDKTNARVLAARLLDSIEKKNKNAFLAVTAFRFAEKVRLRQDADPAFKKTCEAALLKEFARLSGRSFKTKPEEWVFQPLMGGKMVRVAEKSGKSPLDDEDSTFPIYLGKVEGEWALVR